MPDSTVTRFRTLPNTCRFLVASAHPTWHHGAMDARVVRTRRRLQQALLALARERPPSEISVSDIAERAEVNRSTFYQHYADRDTLLADALDEAAVAAGAQLMHVDLDPHTPPQLLVDFLAHIAENAEIYRQTLSGAASGAVIVRLRARVAEMVQVSAEPDPDGHIQGVPLDVVSAGLAGSVLGVITAWLARDPLPPAAEAAGWAWSVLFSPGRALDLRNVAETPQS